MGWYVPDTILRLHGTTLSKTGQIFFLHYRWNLIEWGLLHNVTSAWVLPARIRHIAGLRSSKRHIIGIYIARIVRTLETLAEFRVWHRWRRGFRLVVVQWNTFTSHATRIKVFGAAWSWFRWVFLVAILTKTTAVSKSVRVLLSTIPYTQQLHAIRAAFSLAQLYALILDRGAGFRLCLAQSCLFRNSFSLRRLPILSSRL